MIINSPYRRALTRAREWLSHEPDRDLFHCTVDEQIGYLADVYSEEIPDVTVDAYLDRIDRAEDIKIQFQRIFNIYFLEELYAEDC